MKKTVSAILAVLIVLLLFAGCNQNTSADTDTEKLSIVTTVFPVYDWVKNVLGDADVDVEMLLDTGVDLHSFQPTADDIIKISACDLFIYVGGESDEWVNDALKEKTNPDMVVLNLLDVLGENAKTEEIVEGMEAEHDDGEGEERDHGEEPEYDEHIWLSLKNAVVLTNAIKDAVINLDSADEAKYNANAEAYINSLRTLDVEYENAVGEAKVKTLVFGDRFPFRYMTDDYGLEYFAAFAGCSAESEASFETIAFLASKVDELSLKSVLAIEGTDHRIAETVVSTTKNKDAAVLSLNSMQSVTATDVENGATYLGIAESNLEVLKQALN